MAIEHIANLLNIFEVCYCVHNVLLMVSFGSRMCKEMFIRIWLILLVTAYLI
jgi:hypothetical protein